MLSQDGSPFTAHTTAPVPLALVDFAETGRTLDGRLGALCDIAPTLLELIGLEAPAAMTGRRGGRGWRPAPSRPATRTPAPPLP